MVIAERANFYLAVLAVSLIGGHYTGQLAFTSELAFVAASRASFVALMMWLYYVALEPYVRRFWPTMLITWTRLMHGKLTDPIVARDILVGLLIGCLGQVFVKACYFGASRYYGFDLPPYSYGDATALVGTRHALANLTNCYLLALSSGLFVSMFLFVLRLPLQTKGIASVIFVVFHTAQLSLGGEAFTWAINLVFWTAVVILLTRFGLVALISFLFVSHCVMSFPIPQSLGSWYLGTATLPLLAVLGLASFAYYCVEFRAPSVKQIGS